MVPRVQGRLLLRRMQASDLDDVVRLEHEAHQHPWSADLIRRELDHDWSTVLLAFENSTEADAAGGTGRLAGHIIFWLVHDELHVLNVATAVGCRRRGYGRALMEEAEAIGRARGAAISTLEARKTNEAALSLYRGMGYRQVGLRPRYYVDDNEDAVVMMKDLARLDRPAPPP